MPEIPYITREKNVDGAPGFIINVSGTGNKLAVNVFEDVPVNKAGVFSNTRYSTNYNIQTFITHSYGNAWYRLVNRNTFAVYTDWTPICSGLPNLKILALGDSICYGYRNSGKGFVGDLGLAYKNIGVSSATLSTKVTTVKNIPQQLIDETAFEPDVIIAEGGINDYINSAPLGIVPSAPVTTDSEASALDRSTLLGGAGYLFYYMIKKFPEAQRYFIITHKVKTAAGNYYPTKNNDEGYTQQDMHDALVELCNIYNVKVIDIYKDGFLNSAFSQYVSTIPYSTDPTVTDTEYIDNDGLHPLALGYKECYIPMVKRALLDATKK